MAGTKHIANHDIKHDGVRVAPGEPLTLTADEAKKLGDAVSKAGGKAEAKDEQEPKE